MKIDFVYSWVDGEDPVWKEKKNKHAGKIVSVNNESHSDCRYIENDELKYSLRSLEKNAPWINRIFILTDKQIPSWLDTSKVTIVDHTEVMPKNILPTFNSTVIGLSIAKIPGLSEHFIYGNDDCYIGKPIDPNFFFSADGKPIVRLRHRNILYYKWLKRNSDHAQIVHNAIKQINTDFGVKYSVATHHNLDAFNKTTFLECLEKYSEWIGRTNKNKFRSPDNPNTCLISLYSLATNQANLKYINGNAKNCDSKHILVGEKGFSSAIEKYTPTLFCLNDFHHTTDADRVIAKGILEKMFSNKSKFEK